MLTKSDLKQIQKVVKGEVKSEVDPLKKDIKAINATLKKDISTLKKDVTKIRKDMKIVVSLFDREYLELRARVDRLEKHLSLEPLPSVFA